MGKKKVQKTNIIPRGKNEELWKETDTLLNRLAEDALDSCKLKDPTETRHTVQKEMFKEIIREMCVKVFILDEEVDLLWKRYNQKDEPMVNIDTLYSTLKYRAKIIMKERVKAKREQKSEDEQETEMLVQAQDSVVTMKIVDETHERREGSGERQAESSMPAQTADVEKKETEQSGDVQIENSVVKHDETERGTVSSGERQAESSLAVETAVFHLDVHTETEEPESFSVPENLELLMQEVKETRTSLGKIGAMVEKTFDNQQVLKAMVERTLENQQDLKARVEKNQVETKQEIADLRGTMEAILRALSTRD